MKVLVTTTRRGVFYGELESHERTGPDTYSAVLRGAQMVVRWRNTRGVFGLCVDGPNEHCRISKPAPRITLEGVYSIAEVAVSAQAAFAERPWSE